MSDSTLYRRALGWAQRRRERTRGRNPWVMAVSVVRNSADDRVAGLAAEMAFWALLSLFPLLVTVAALLGFAERVIGPDNLALGRAAIISATTVMFSPELTREVVRPFLDGLLAQERGGVALGSLAAALYLASRVFSATIRSLDLAYRVPERRGLLELRLTALAFGSGFVVAGVVTVLVMVLGPLLGTGQSLAVRLGLSRELQVLWLVARWPVLLALMVAFLAVVYRYGPSVRHRWLHCLPGAAFAVLAWVLASAALRVFLRAGGGGAGVISGEDEAVAVVSRLFAGMVAFMLWVFLTGLAILVGGELNAEVARGPRGGHPVRPAAASGTMPRT